MVSHHVFYQLVLIILVWVFLMLYGLWPSESAATRLTIPQPNTPPRKRSRAPKPFTGLTRKPQCDACEQGGELHRELPCAPPPLITSTCGRQRHVDTSHHFCPEPTCSYGGWLGRGNISANGHPSGGPGDSCIAATVGATFSKPMARSFMVNACQSSSLCTSSGA